MINHGIPSLVRENPYIYHFEELLSENMEVCTLLVSVRLK